MSILEAIILGIIQGFTEFLPISSTGHLRIVPALLGWPDPGAAFTAITQLGTMAAVLIYFRNDLWRIASAWLAGLRDKEKRGELDSRMGWYLIAGTIPIAIFGYLFRHEIETSARSLQLIGVHADRARPDPVRGRTGSAGRCATIDSVKLPDGVVMGFAQALALVPGVSRSGATITAGLFLGFTRADAARFSFLLSVPAVVLSGLFELRSYLGDGGTVDEVVPLVVATVVAFISGYAAIAFLLRWLAEHTLTIFVVYRIVLGVVVLVLAGNGTIS